MMDSLEKGRLGDCRLRVAEFAEQCEARHIYLKYCQQLYTGRRGRDGVSVFFVCGVGFSHAGAAYAAL